MGTNRLINYDQNDKLVTEHFKWWKPLKLMKIRSNWLEIWAKTMKTVLITHNISKQHENLTTKKKQFKKQTLRNLERIHWKFHIKYNFETLIFKKMVKIEILRGKKVMYMEMSKTWSNNTEPWVKWEQMLLKCYKFH